MSNENNKIQIDIENLFKQNVNDLSAIKELYRKLKEVEEKFSQIKYIDSTLANKLKKEYEKLKRIILDENIQAKLANDIEAIDEKFTNDIETITNDIETIDEKLTNGIETIDEKLTNSIETINSQLDANTNKTNLIINVKDFGVLGDGVTNDTNALIKAFEFAQENETISKTIIFPKGVYLVNGESSSSKNSEYGRLRVPSNTIVDLCGSEIKMIKNDRPNSSIFRIIYKENIEIKNGTFHGDFDNGKYVLGEWSFGVSVQDSKNIIVKDSSFYNFRGDGIYFSYEDTIGNANDNILIKNCLVDTVHRNGISITRGKNVIIDGCTIRNTTGNCLGAGIDIEPDHDNEDEYVQYLVLSNNKFYNIKGSALRVQYCKNAKVYNNTVLNSLTPVETREAYDIEIYDNYFDGISGVNCSGYNLGNIVIRNNTFINFADTNLPGYTSSCILLNQVDKEGKGKIIFKDNIIQNLITGICILIPSGNTEIIRNRVDNIPSEFVRARGNSKVNIFENTLSNFSNSVTGIIRARDNSYINIKNNTFDSQIDIIIPNSETATHNTDIQAYQPNVGHYIAGQFIKNGSKKNVSIIGWLCTSTGDFSSDVPPTFKQIVYPE